MIDALDRNRQIKDYISNLFAKETIGQIYARENSLQNGLKHIEVPAMVGKMLYLLTRLQQPKRVLEIGTLGGYSTLWLARALTPDAKIITVDYDENSFRIARGHFEVAACEIEMRLGSAEIVLKKMISDGEAPFDLIFIDADKEEYPLYLELAISLSRSGTLILSDNLIPKRGEIEAPDPRDVEANAIYAFNQRMANHPRLDSSLFPTIVGENGRVDALGVAIVN